MVAAIIHLSLTWTANSLTTIYGRNHRSSLQYSHLQSVMKSRRLNNLPNRRDDTSIFKVRRISLFIPPKTTKDHLIVRNRRPRVERLLRRGDVVRQLNAVIHGAALRKLTSHHMLISMKLTYSPARHMKRETLSGRLRLSWSNSFHLQPPLPRSWKRRSQVPRSDQQS